MTPRGPWSRSWGARCPRAFEVRVVEESADTIYLVLPSASVVGQGELSDQELEAVAGASGIPADTYDSLTCSGALCY